MIMRFFIRLAEKFTPFDADLLSWSQEQERSALHATIEIRKRNKIEELLLTKALHHD